MKTSEKLAKLTKLVEDFNQGNFAWRNIVAVKMAIQDEMTLFLTNAENDGDPARPTLQLHHMGWRHLSGHNAKFSEMNDVAALLELQLKAFKNV